jgi:HEAT repeat protein
MTDIAEMERNQDVPGLIAALKDGDGIVRARAAEALGRIGDPQAIGPLLEVHFTDPYGRSLLPPPDDPSYDYVLGMGIEAEYPVREVAGAALEGFADAQVVEAFIAALGNEEMRNFALLRLTKIGSPAVEALIAALTDQQWRVRGDVAGALGEIADARAVEPLIAALKDENHFVRSSTAKALGKIADARAVDPLIGALRDKEWYVRATAAEALGKIADPRALGPLYTAQKDANSSVRTYAESAYRKTRDRNLRT